MRKIFLLILRIKVVASPKHSWHAAWQGEFRWSRWILNHLPVFNCFAFRIQNSLPLRFQFRWLRTLSSSLFFQIINELTPLPLGCWCWNVFKNWVKSQEEFVPYFVWCVVHPCDHCGLSPMYFYANLVIIEKSKDRIWLFMYPIPSDIDINVF